MGKENSFVLIKLGRKITLNRLPKRILLEGVAFLLKGLHSTVISPRYGVR